MQNETLGGMASGAHFELPDPGRDHLNKRVKRVAFGSDSFRNYRIPTLLVPADPTGRRPALCVLRQALITHSAQRWSIYPSRWLVVGTYSRQTSQLRGYEILDRTISDRTARVAFLLRGQLGWSTNVSTVVRALAERPDVLARLHVTQGGGVMRTVSSPRLRVPLRRINLARESRRVGRALQNDGGVEVVHAAGHLVAMGAMRYLGHLPLSIMFDGTASQAIDIHGMDSERQRKLRAERSIFESASLLGATSEWARNAALQEYDLRPSSISIRPFNVYGPNEETVERTSVLRNSRNRRQIIFIGTDWHRKGGDRLLEHYLAELRDICDLHIVSANAPAIAHESVYVHGAVDNRQLVEELLPQMDLLVHPTRFDHSSIVGIEASAVAIPTVMTRCPGGANEVIDDGVTGYVADSMDDFVEHCRGLLTDDARRIAMGRAARQRFLDVFDARVVTSSLLDDLVDLADRHRPQASERGA